MRRQPFPSFRLVTVVISILISIVILAACNSSPEETIEILIGIEPTDISLLINPSEPDPARTGIPSLDVLNEEWQVMQMVPLYPSIAPDDEIAARYGLTGVFKLVVPKSINLSQMIEAYTADSHIQYAEQNKPAQINE